MIFSKIVLIIGDGDLGEKVAQRFRKWGEYLPAFEAPIRDFPNTGVFDSDCIRIQNACAYLKPEITAFVGCGQKVLDRMLPNFPAHKTIILNQLDEAKLAQLPGFRKKERGIKIAETKAEEIFSGDIIVLEKGDKTQTLIAKNLAAALNGYLVNIPGVARDQVSEFSDHLSIWNSNAQADIRENARNKVFEFIDSHLGVLLKKSVRSFSFITLGIPYGIYPFTCPTTHYFSFPQLGLNIIKGMLKSVNAQLRCPAVILINPGEFENDEFDNLRRDFGSKNYVLRKAYGRNATVRDAHYLSEYCPSDFIFFSTHCGEVEGQRIHEKFVDPEGNVHILCYDLAYDFIPSSNPELIAVTHFKKFVSLDEVDWEDSEGKDRINAEKIMTDYFNLIREDNYNAEIVKQSDIGIIRGSDSLKLFDGVFIPMPQEVGGHKYPLVFNNACSSWKELGIRYSCAGASIYIGTTCDIPNMIAKEVVSRFSKRVSEGHVIGHSLFNAQKSFISDLGYSPYLMEGFIFSKLEPPQERGAINFAKIRDLLNQEYLGWRNHASKARTEEVKRNSNEIAEFLKVEIQRSEGKSQS